MSPERIVVAVLVGLVSTVQAEAAPRIEVQGHRGARALRPENTLAGFAYALSVGVDTIELDLAVTRDDELVVNHELWVHPARCRGPGGAVLEDWVPIRTLTLPEVQRYDCGSVQDTRFERQQSVPGERIPSLGQVFALRKGRASPAAKAVRLNVELKSVPAKPELTPTPQRYAALVVDLVRKEGWTGRVNVQAFDHRLLAAVKALAPELPVAVLLSRSLPDLVAVARSARAEIVSPNHEWITSVEVKALHAAGLRVVPWTANDEGAWRRLVRLGVDGIITDDPGGLIAYLRAKALR